MSIVDRIKNICLTPNTEWPVIANEQSSTGSLITGYVAPLAAVSAIAGFIGVSFIGTNTFFAGTYRIICRACAAVWRSSARSSASSGGLHHQRARADVRRRAERARAMKVAVFFTPACRRRAAHRAGSACSRFSAPSTASTAVLGLPALMKAPKERRRLHRGHDHCASS